MESRTAGREAWSMDHTHFNAVARDSIAVLNEMLDRAAFRHRHAYPLGLDIELFKQEEIGFMDGGRSVCALLQLGNGAHMIDVRVRADDLHCRQAMLFETLQYFQGIVTRIDDDGFAGLFVAKNGAIALK